MIFKDSCKAWYEKLFVSSSYIRDLCDGLERQEFCQKNYYEGFISTESHESTEYDKNGHQKIIHIYSFEVLMKKAEILSKIYWIIIEGNPMIDKAYKVVLEVA